MSTHPLVNILLGLTDDLIGGSSLMWRYHHQVRGWGEGRGCWGSVLGFVLWGIVLCSGCKFCGQTCAASVICQSLLMPCLLLLLCLPLLVLLLVCRCLTTSTPMTRHSTRTCAGGQLGAAHGRPWVLVLLALGTNRGGQEWQQPVALAATVV